MNREDFVKELGIEKTGSIAEDDSYVISLDNSDEFSKVYTKLDKSDLVDLSPDEMIMTEHSGLMIYLSDDFELKLEADFDKDVYTLIISEL